MKLTFVKTVLYLTIALLFVSATTALGQKEFLSLQTSADSSFGYTTQNPMRLKKGNQQKSMEYAYNFLIGLRTQDGQTLKLLSRATVINPSHRESKIKLTNRFTGMPLSGNLGLLDRYEFLTVNTKDTVRLYVDTYNKGELYLPVGLKYEHAN
ncbi:MAG TPA: hypothetical protein VM368_08995 [Flavisolibacter sp.]|nr:hypothetical protein [Flavisolibacter sp.]